jgi:hypothetical protein
MNVKPYKSLKMQKTEEIPVIAVSEQDFIDYGCPNCGGIFGFYPISGGGAGVWDCSDCGAQTVIFGKFLTTFNQPSPIAVNNVRPVLVSHPKSGQPKVNREALIKQREVDVWSGQLASFKKSISQGYGVTVEPKVVSNHNSKSCDLPIVSAEKEGSNVSVAWFGNNFYSHYLGLKFKEPICASLLYPISGEFDSPPYSSHVNMKVAQPLPDFIKASYTQRMISSLGMTTGKVATSIMIRFLEEISKLNTKKILKACFNPKDYGKQLAIDGNYVDTESLLKAVDLKVCEEKHDFFVLPEDSIFSSMELCKFDDDRGGCSIRVEMKEGNFLPPMPFPASGLFANPLDTKLADYLPDDVQKRECNNPYSSGYIMSYIPVGVMKYERITDPFLVKHEPLFVYGCLKPGFKELIFGVPNLLDAVMTAVFLIKVIDPISKIYFKD